MTRPAFEYVSPAVADALSTLDVSATVTQADASSFAAPTLYAADDAAFRFVGAGQLTFGDNYPDTFLLASASRWPNVRDSQWTVGVEFDFTGQAFEVRYKYLSASRYQLFVDGRPTTPRAVAFGGDDPGWIHRLLVDLGAEGTYRIRIVGESLPFGGVWTEAGDSIAAPADDLRLRMVFQGDSLVAGSAESESPFTYRLARYLGADDPWNEALGSTGYLAAGSTVALSERNALDVLAHDPDAVLLWAGYNDVPTYTAAAVAAAAASLVAEILDVADPPRLVLLGAWSPAAVAWSGHEELDDALREVAVSAGVEFLSPITGEVVDSDGQSVITYGKWINADNVDLTIGADNVHPTDVGCDLIAATVAAGLQAIDALAVSTAPTLAQVKAYLGVTSATDAEIGSALAAEVAAQARVVTIPDAYPDDLAEALKRRVARNLALRGIPLAVKFGGEAGPTYVPGRDPEVRRLEAPHRKRGVG